MIQKLKVFYQRQTFFPGLLGIFVNPFFLARTGLRDAIEHFASNIGGRLLDVGCGTKPYQELFVVDTYIGLDIDNEATRKRGVADFLYEGKHFPFDDGEFDAILCNQVLEHVFNPDEFLHEINRVLKPGGKLLLTVPFVWDEHEQPYDYARYSSFGLRALLKNKEFKIVEHQKIGSYVTTIFQLINAYLYKTTIGLPKFFKFILSATVMAFFNIMGLLFKCLLPINQDLFLDQIVLAERTK